MVEAPRREVHFLGGRATLLAYGTYRGTDRAGFDSWHDQEGRKEKPRTSAALIIDQVTLHRVTYRGRVEFARDPHTGKWGLRGPVWIRRANAEPATQAAVKTIRDGAERLLAETLENDTGFLEIEGERYAILLEKEHAERDAAEWAEKADQALSRAATLGKELAALDAGQLSLEGVTNEA